MTIILFGLAVVLGAELGFILGAYVYGKRVEAYRQALDGAMKGWQESIELLKEVATQAGVPIKDAEGNTLSPIQVDKK